MPADTDHIRRDALHAARSIVRIEIAKYLRRLDAEAKADIEKHLAELEGEVDGTSIGFSAARAALSRWGVSDPLDAVDAPAAQLEAAADS